MTGTSVRPKVQIKGHIRGGIRGQGRIKVRIVFLMRVPRKCPYLRIVTEELSGSLFSPKPQVRANMRYQLFSQRKRNVAAYQLASYRKRYTSGLIFPHCYLIGDVKRLRVTFERGGATDRGENGLDRVARYTKVPGILDRGNPNVQWHSPNESRKHVPEPPGVVFAERHIITVPKSSESKRNAKSQFLQMSECFA